MSAVNRRQVAMVAVATVIAGLGSVVAASPAHAASPDAFGIAVWRHEPPQPPGQPLNSAWPPGSTIVATPPNHYHVTFPGQAAKGGAVHVTAVRLAPRWCQVVKFGPNGADEEVEVDCFAVGGVPAESGFTIQFASSSGPSPDHYATVDSDAAGTVLDDYNSAAGGPGNFVGKGPVGVYYVRLPDLKTPGPLDGGLQVTAVGSVPARCKPTDWQLFGSYGQVVTVLCFGALGNPLDSGWTLSYQYRRTLYGGPLAKNLFGYYFNPPPAIAPGETNFNSLLGPNANTMIPAGPGLYLLTFPKVAQQPDSVQITAYGKGSEFCGLNGPWARFGHDVIVRDVNCFDTFGNPVNTWFLASYNTVS